jgi:hypothetical protein
MAAGRNVVVINDEAHHAWRVPAESKVKGIKKEDIGANSRRSSPMSFRTCGSVIW